MRKGAVVDVGACIAGACPRGRRLVALAVVCPPARVGTCRRHRLPAGDAQRKQPEQGAARYTLT